MVYTPWMIHLHSRPMPADYGMDDGGFARYQIAETAWLKENWRLAKRDIWIHVWGLGLGVIICGVSLLA